MANRKSTGRKVNPKSLSNLRKGGGRPKGVPNKVTTEMKALARLLTTDNPKYVASLARRLERGKAHPTIEAAILAYGHGRPTERIELEHQIPEEVLDAAVERRLASVFSDVPPSRQAALLRQAAVVFERQAGSGQRPDRA